MFNPTGFDRNLSRPLRLVLILGRSGYWDEGQYNLGHGSNGNHDRKFESEGSGLVGGADLVSHHGSGAHVLLDEIPLEADGVSC